MKSLANENIPIFFAKAPVGSGKSYENMV